MKAKQTRLRLGAILHFLIAFGHVLCLFFLDKAFRAYGISEKMNSLCLGQDWLPYAMTICLAVAFAIAGLYALSASGDMVRLPLQRFVILMVICLYGMRTLVGIYWLIGRFTYLELFSTLAPAILVWCYLPGLSKLNDKDRN